MTALPLVTIGLPFYNNETTIKLAIQSVFAQTYTNWELIAIDDGSKDSSAAIFREISDPRVKLISDGKNLGLIARLNQLATLGSGEYLARMDADDLMTPDRIEKQMRLLLASPDTDLVDTGTYSINENGNPSGKRGLNDINYDPRYVLKHAMLLHASIVGKRKWFLDNPYDKDYLRAEDYELWCRTFRFSKFERVKEPLYIVREGRVNVRNYAKSSATIRKILRQYGPGILTKTEINLELLKSHLKVGAYKLFSVFNQHDYLSRKRNISLTPAEVSQVKQILQNIENVNIKGTDG